MQVCRKLTPLLEDGIAHYILPVILVVVVAVLGGYTYSRIGRADAIVNPVYFQSSVASKCLDDWRDSTTEGTKVDLYNCNKTAAQEWTVNSNGTIENANGKCLDNWQAINKNGNPIRMYRCSATDGAQQWRVTGNVLKNPMTNKCVDDPDASTANGTQLQLFTCLGNKNQGWTAVAVAPKPGTPKPTPTPTPIPTPTPTPVSSGCSDPSGACPPTSLSGYKLAYTQEFTGTSVPSNWYTYDGVPGGETSSQGVWSSSMCKFSGGEAHFMASGITGCGMGSHANPQTYGAYFVRLKGDIEPPGHYSDIALLWPADTSWSAEIDYYEDMCPTTGICSRNAYDASVTPCPNGGCWYSKHDISNTGSSWHTYGVEWTPNGVTFLDDGKVVAQTTATLGKAANGAYVKAPNVPMVEDLQSQDLDGTPVPANTETMTVDWVAEFSYN